MTANPTAKTERELVALCRRIDEVNRLNDRKVHLFMDLRAAGVTQARIGELAGLSDVGVHNAISRHVTRHAKGRATLPDARDDKERAEAEALLCAICAEAEEPVGADA